MDFFSTTVIVSHCIIVVLVEIVLKAIAFWIIIILVFSFKGLDSGSTQNNKNGTRAWGAILGTALVVGFVGLIIYVLLKRKGHREFSHTKLVEETSSDPGKSRSDTFNKLQYYNMEILQELLCL